MEKKYFLAIDCGTSALKAIVYDKEFRPVVKTSDETHTVYPKPNWAEQIPSEWWASTIRCVKKDLEKVSPEEIMGIGITSQGHGPVFVDAQCNPLYNCLIWPDLRAVAEADELNAAGFVSSMGPIVSAHYAAAKLFWVKRNLPEVFNKAYKLLIPKDFLRTKMTMDFTTDSRGAISTQLVERDTNKWQWKLIDYIGFPREKIPEIHSTEEIVGYVTKTASLETGLSEGTPVIVGPFNGPITPILISLANKGKIKPEDDYIILYLGTAPGVSHFSLRVGYPGAPPAEPPPFQGGYMSASGGGLIKWYKEQFGIFEKEVAERMDGSPYQLLDEEASKVEPGSEGLIFLPHMMGERRPYNDFARGVLFGLSLGHRREHFYRSVLEGIIFHLKLIYDVGRGGKEVKIDKLVMFGGGTKSRVWKQIVADIFGYPVYTLTEEEAATLNLACMISVGLKVYPDFTEAAKHVDVDFKDVTNPSAERVKYEKPYALFKKVSESLEPVFTKEWSAY
ncbi:MAG: xylulokinase [Thermoproteota archaeon]|nr:xylulokinase [Thermoproteota archaeon]